MAAFLGGLAENGYVEGQSVTLEYRWAPGQYDQLPAIAADFVRARVAVLVTALRERCDEHDSNCVPTGDDPVKLD